MNVVGDQMAKKALMPVMRMDLAEAHGAFEVMVRMGYLADFVKTSSAMGVLLELGAT